MTEKLKNLIANLKHLPGVYLMHNEAGEIIYVGKAKDLQKRVSQYFLSAVADHLDRDVAVDEAPADHAGAQVV